MLSTSCHIWLLLEVEDRLMEVFHRQRNTSLQVSTARRVEILSKFVIKLRESGYGVKTVNRIIQEGNKFYYRRVQVELEGGPKVNTRSEDNLVMGRRAKMRVAETWFQRRQVWLPLSLSAWWLLSLKF